KLSGMTGTAVTEAEEFRKIYSVDVIAVPTNMPVIREDKADIIYKTTGAKYTAIANEIERLHKIGQPILVGTRSINHNQIVSDFLNRKKVPHQVLNAKNHEKEAFIIADAGKKGAITVATNIAGRGVDIVLGGAKPELKDFRKKTLSTAKPSAELEKLAKSLRLPPSINPSNYKLKQYQTALETWQADHDAVVELGGLHILGTERHESRRIDNQLRGRAGRQGDPGTSQFFISLDDEIMRIFGGEQISKIMDMLKIDEGQPIEHGMIGKSIEAAQVKVEGFFFDQRKRLVEFDDVMNRQREIIYARRRRLLEEGSDSNSDADQADTEQESQGLQDQILGYVQSEIESIVSINAPKEYTEEEYSTIVKEFCRLVPFDTNSQRHIEKEIAELTDADAITEKLQEIAADLYKQRVKQLTEPVMQQLALYVTLSTVDEKWMDHLDAMDNLREGIWLRGDKQTVLSEYKKEAFGMFQQMLGSIESTIASRVFRLQPVNRDQLRQVQPQQMVEQKDDIHEELAKEVADATVPTSAPSQVQGSSNDLAAALRTAKAVAKPQPGSKQMKIGRNDPCPCGSGLKYKKCGLIGAPEHRG
ncbi:SEC-C domain-containing protein, partial [Candidatus Woesebacteria bacterium]|nr:SEC-C domain-containing protein [Candidatus Woesebacteria bacterium]